MLNNGFHSNKSGIYLIFEKVPEKTETFFLAIKIVEQFLFQT